MFSTDSSEGIYYLFISMNWRAQIKNAKYYTVCNSNNISGIIYTCNKYWTLCTMFSSDSREAIFVEDK